MKKGMTLRERIETVYAALHPERSNTHGSIAWFWKELIATTDAEPSLQSVYRWADLGAPPQAQLEVNETIERLAWQAIDEAKATTKLLRRVF